MLSYEPPGEVIKMSPASKANQRAVDKYVKENYDRIEIKVPKGRKEAIRTHASAQGESLNGFISKAVDERIERLEGDAAENTPVEDKE